MTKLFPLILIVLLASCRIERKIYSSLPVNNPSLQKKNDYSVNASLSAPRAFDLNGGFALTNRIAVIAGAYTHKNRDYETDFDDSSKLQYRHNGITIGAGTYFPLSKSKSPGYLSFYAGMSNGRFKMNESRYKIQPDPPGPPVLNFYKSKMNRFFLQGSINQYWKSGEASLTTRYSLINYKNIITDYTDAELSGYQLPPFVRPRFSSFFDLTVDTKIFFSNNPRWGIQFFAMIANRLDQKFEDNNFYYYPFRIGTGVFFRGFVR